MEAKHDGGREGEHPDRPGDGGSRRVAVRSRVGRSCPRRVDEGGRRHRRAGLAAVRATPLPPETPVLPLAPFPARSKADGAGAGDVRERRREAQPPADVPPGAREAELRRLAADDEPEDRGRHRLPPDRQHGRRAGVPRRAQRFDEGVRGHERPRDRRPGQRRRDSAAERIRATSTTDSSTPWPPPAGRRRIGPRSGGWRRRSNRSGRRPRTTSRTGTTCSCGVGTGPGTRSRSSS